MAIPTLLRFPDRPDSNVQQGLAYSVNIGRLASPSGCRAGLGLRQHPKSKRSHRVVPPRTLEGMSVLMADREHEALVFTAAGSDLR